MPRWLGPPQRDSDMGTYVVLGIALPYATCVRTIKLPKFEHDHPLEWEYDPLSGQQLWDSYPALVESLGDSPDKDGNPRPLKVGHEVADRFKLYFDGNRVDTVIGNEVGWFGAKTEHGTAGFDLSQLQTELETIRPGLFAIANAVEHTEEAQIGLWFVTL